MKRQRQLEEGERKEREIVERKSGAGERERLREKKWRRKAPWSSRCRIPFLLSGINGSRNRLIISGDVDEKGIPFETAPN